MLDEENTLEPNATTIDSAIYRDMFSTDAMRQVWSDSTRVQRYLDVEKALFVAQDKLGVIPQEAVDEIVQHCDVAQMDFGKLKSVTEHVGYPMLPVVEQLTVLARTVWASGATGARPRRILPIPRR